MVSDNQSDCTRHASYSKDHNSWHVTAFTIYLMFGWWKVCDVTVEYYNYCYMLTCYSYPQGEEVGFFQFLVDPEPYGLTEVMDHVISCVLM